MAEVIYSEVSGDNDLPGRLFDGIKFWLAQTVPQRSRFVDNVKARNKQSVRTSLLLIASRPMVERSSSWTNWRI